MLPALRPPGLMDRRLVSDLPAELSPESRYLFMEWVLRHFREDPARADVPATAREHRRAAETEILEKWRERTLTAHAPFLVPGKNGALTFSQHALRRSADLATAEAALQKLRRDMECPLQVVATADEIEATVIWKRLSPKHQAHFQAWLVRRTVALAEPTGLRRNDVAQAAAQCLEALAEHADVDQLVTRAAQRRSDGNLHDARQLLWEARDQARLLADAGLLAPSQMQWHIAEAIADVNRELFADELRQLERKIARYLTPAGTNAPAEQNVANAETTLADTLRDWLEDEQFAGVFQHEHAGVLRLAQNVAGARARIWRAELEQRTGGDDVVGYYRLLKRRLDATDPQSHPLYRACTVPEATQTGTQQPCRTVIEDAVLETVPTALGQALDTCLKLADREVNNSLHHGLGLSLCAVLDGIVESVPERRHKLLEPLAERIQQLHERQRRSRAFFLRNVADRKLAVAEFSSGVPGLGRALARDLEQQLRHHYKEQDRRGRIVRVVADREKLAPRDLEVVDGHVAEFAVSDAPERRTRKMVTRWTEATEEDNSNYLRKLPSGHTDKRPRFYRQKLLKHVIHTRALERIAHVRVTCRLQGEATDEFVEVNEFFRKTFLQEESHPFNDAREIKMLRAFDQDRLHAEAPELKLRVDRAWSASEMLDWARKEALQLLRMHVTRAIDSMPLRLAEKARLAQEDKAWVEAAHLWGYVLEYCRNITPTADAAPRSKTDLADLPQHLRTRYEQEQQFRRQLFELRETAEAGMLDAVQRFLENERTSDTRPD